MFSVRNLYGTKINRNSSVAHNQDGSKLREKYADKQKWKRFGPDGKIRGDCARGSSKEGKPKCLPASKAYSMSKKDRAKSARRKRRQDPDKNRSGKAKNVKT